MRIRIIKNEGKYRSGQVLEVNKKLAYKLIRSGIAVLSKELIEQDYKTK